MLELCVKSTHLLRKETRKRIWRKSKSKFRTKRRDTSLERIQIGFIKNRNATKIALTYKDNSQSKLNVK